MEKPNAPRWAIALIVFALVIFLASWGNVTVEPSTKATKYLNLLVLVSDHSSGSVQGDNITFWAKPGKSVNGNTIIKHDGRRVSNVQVSLEGGLADIGWAKVPESDRRFQLQPGQTKSVGLTITVPSDASGNRTGRLRVEGL
jgi:uncharacterized membrane protein